MITTHHVFCVLAHFQVRLPPHRRAGLRKSLEDEYPPELEHNMMNTNGPLDLYQTPYGYTTEQKRFTGPVTCANRMGTTEIKIDEKGSLRSVYNTLHIFGPLSFSSFSAS